MVTKECGSWIEWIWAHDLLIKLRYLKQIMLPLRLLRGKWMIIPLLSLTFCLHKNKLSRGCDQRRSQFLSITCLCACCFFFFCSMSETCAVSVSLLIGRGTISLGISGKLMRLLFLAPVLVQSLCLNCCHIASLWLKVGKTCLLTCRTFANKVKVTSSAQRKIVQDKIYF